jgi:tetraacyldisaccharide 4'-kinase
VQKVISILLIPFSLLYGIGVSIYQSLFYSGIIKAVKFSFPVISIGNLSVGGTGKSPHIEYLIRMLKDYVHIAVLSRGYKRNTSGFLLVEKNHNAKEVGDEPCQMKNKFPEIPIAVSENRSLGIPRLLRNFPELNLILLDDAFQHLGVKPGLNILLTEFSNPYVNDYLLPSGRLREWRYGAMRADVIVVTKCPEHLTESEFKSWKEKLQLRDHQTLFFSKIQYGTPYHIFNTEKLFFLNPGLHITLISAIAQSSYLVNYLSTQVASVVDYNFEDHHYFTESELQGLLVKHNQISHPNKMILTTEKDATRLQLFREFFEQRGIEIYAIPIDVKFYQEELFQQYIKSYLLDFKI